ncbi:MAG TPA: hypothetical protein VMU81_02360 [Acetobacteraceae bacterium]|nr:hypothetical protein [Acetobacteraceae bacterium]
MIRPITCLAFLLACGSGLYLYQVKHRVKVLDDQIAAIAKSTDTLREQTRMLSAEWTLLNDPERLRKLADEFLNLQPVSPEQFTSLADLNNRLPPPMPQGAPPASGTSVPAVAEQTPVSAAGAVAAADAATQADVASTADAATPAASGAVASPPTITAAVSPRAVADAASPKPSAPDAKDAARATDAAAPVAQSPVVAAAKPAFAAISPKPYVASSRVAAAADVPRIDNRRMAPHPPPRVVASQSRPAERNAPDWAEQRPVNVHDVAQRAFIPRAVEPRPVMAARMQQPMATGGSFLGMAHDMAAPPPPLPMPQPMPQRALVPYGGSGG